MLKALLLRKKIDSKKKELEALRAKDAELEQRENELKTAIDEVETDEQRTEVEGMVNEFEQEKTSHDEAKKNLEREIGELETELSDEEAKQNTEPPVNPEPEKIRKDDKPMNIRSFFNMSAQERDTFFARDDVKKYLGEIRTAIKEKRAITNIGLTIPQVMLGLLRENVVNYSKLYRHVTVRPVGGEARMLIMGAVPEAIWTDCCANLNELTLGFNDLEMDCYKVGGYFAVCNANLEDSDVDLASELLSALGQAIGIALDKAILYGRNTNDTMKMPMGIISRLVQTSEPAGYPATARTWADLHVSNVKTISSGTTGVSLFAAIATNFGAAKGKYSRGEKVWVMNETTYTYLMAQAMSINAAGAIATGMGATMPVIGGTIEIISFIPDYVMIGGYFDLYILAERAGQKFAQSEHVRFLQDQTVFKGTARYDGAPAIAEAFVAIGVNSTTPDATTGISFGTDEANSVKSIMINTTTATVTAGSTIQLFAITQPGMGEVEWTSATPAKATVNSVTGVVTGVTSGSSVITATANGLTASCTVTVS